MWLAPIFKDLTRGLVKMGIFIFVTGLVVGGAVVWGAYRLLGR